MINDYVNNSDVDRNSEKNNPLELFQCELCQGVYFGIKKDHICPNKLNQFSPILVKFIAGEIDYLPGYFDLAMD